MIDLKWIIVQAVLVLLLLLLRKRVMWFGVAFFIVVVGYAIIVPRYSETWTPVHESRNFFGVKRVLYDRGENTLRLVHGDTIHGVESLDADYAGEPLGYYLRSGPL